jgi:hypothetical protein
MQKFFFLIIFFQISSISSIELMKDYFNYNSLKNTPKVTNDLVKGDTQVSTQVSDFQNIKPNQPFVISVLVTHDKKDSVDGKSFRMGGTPLDANFIKTSQMSAADDIVVSIYQFVYQGLPEGTQTLPPVQVSVGGKKVQSLPLVVEVLKG